MNETCAIILDWFTLPPRYRTKARLMSDILGYLDGKRDALDRLIPRMAELRAELAQARAEKRDLQNELQGNQNMTEPQDPMFPQQIPITGGLPLQGGISPPQISLTPMEMIAQGLAKGASIEILEKLFALQERWEASQQRKDFDQAIAAAKAKIPPIVRNRVGHNHARYSDFAAIAAVVDPIISEHGLHYRFRTVQDDKSIRVTCILGHRSGHQEESTLVGQADTTGSKNAIQAIGSTLTYLQRYTLIQALGLAAAHDDDGKAAGNGKTINDAQAIHLAKLVAETKTDVNKFLTWLGAESIPDILLNKYGMAEGALQRKASQHGVSLAAQDTERQSALNKATKERLERVKK